MREFTMAKAIVATMLMTAALTQTAQAEKGDGHFWLKLQDRNISMDEATSHFGEWLNLPEGTTFKLIGDETDQLGIRHLRYRQYVGGYEVQASTVVVHGRNGTITSANGVVMEQTAQPKVMRKAPMRNDGKTDSAEKLYLVQTPSGFRYAKLHYDFMQNADVYVDAETGETLKTLPLSHSISETMQGRSLYNGTVSLSVTALPDGRRIMADSTRNIFTVDAHNADNNVKDYIVSQTEGGGEYYDCERFIKEQCPVFSTTDDFWAMSRLTEISLDSVRQFDDPFAEFYLVLRDNNGNAVDRTDVTYATSLPLGLHITNIGGKLAFINIASFGIEVWKYNYTGDDVRIDCIGMEKLPVGKHAWKTDNTSGHVVTKAVADPAVDIHWGMQQTYNWYKTVVGRDSYDDKGGPIYNILFAPDINFFIGMKGYENNAFANYSPKFNCYVMQYGIGDDILMHPVVGIDIMAHEFTHLVTNCTAGLEYKGESGALNESFSDIMGICVKKAVKGSKAADNWLIGDGVMVQASCMRDMSHRVAGTNDIPLPIYYKGDDWSDDSDMHVNSAVQNYWFYLLNVGFDEIGQPDLDGSLAEFASKIDIDDAAKIAYRSLTKYLTPTSNHADARKGSLQATADLFGENSEEYQTVQYAWDYVGVTEDDDPATAIHATAADKKSPTGDVWHNLQGQRIDAPSQSGVYIHNGKKIVVK